MLPFNLSRLNLFNGWGGSTRAVTGKLSYSAPARKFELVTGLSGISKPWKMPDNDSYPKVQNEYFPHYSSLVRAYHQGLPLNDSDIEYVVQLFDKLSQLNPELKEFDYLKARPTDLADVVFGAISQFNSDDIKYFVEIPIEQRSPDLHRRRNIIELRVSRAMHWVASPTTSANIEQQLDQNPRYKSKIVLDPDNPALCQWDFAFQYLQSRALRSRFGPLTGVVKKATRPPLFSKPGVLLSRFSRS